jgi:adenylylsulfate kinase
MQVEPGFAVWLTGLPAAGKSSIARELQRLLAEQGVQAIILDSDELRRVLTPQPSYTESERDWFYGVIAGLVVWLTRNGVNVLIAATAHRRVYRDQARAQIARFGEVEVRCPLETCRARDRKGIYVSARAGQADKVPGMGVAYEPPLQPEAVVDTTQCSPSAAALSAMSQLQQVLKLSSRPAS